MNFGAPKKEFPPNLSEVPVAATAADVAEREPSLPAADCLKASFPEY